MRLKNILLFLIGFLLLSLAGIVVFLLSGTIVEEGEPSPTSFSVIETGTANDFAYAVYSFRGEGNLTMLSYGRAPKRSVIIINDSQAVQATRLPEFAARLETLERYGYTVTVSDEPKVGDAVYVVPSGAIPSYVLFNLQQGSSNGTIIYIGDKDLLLSNGIKRLNWYDQLTESQKERIVLYSGTLDEFMENSSISLERDILHSSWMVKNSTTYALSGDGLGTAVAGLNETGFVRLIYDFPDIGGIFDSSRLEKSGEPLEPSPGEIYPWERSSLQFTLNKTNGTAFFTVKREGKIIEHEQLRRVTDQNVFIKKFEYSEPGDYVLLAEDNSGVIASGLLHVKDIRIVPVEKRGYSIVFSVTVDGKPLDNEEVMVSLDNSTKKRFYVSDGTLVVFAKPNKGINVFEMEIGGATIPVRFENNDDSVLDFYLSYGIPAFALIFIVYFGARLTRRPTYQVRFGDSADYVRQEIALPTGRAIESFRRIRADMKLGRSPITPHEFSVSLKRYLTNGADVTDGNVDEILRKLVKSSLLETHRDYYQLRGEGDVVRNVLRRMVREKLIESGTPFSENGDKFITNDFEIGFAGEKFFKKAIVIVDDVAEEKSMLDKLSETERARLRILQSNGMVSFVLIDRLSDEL